MVFLDLKVQEVQTVLEDFKVLKVIYKVLQVM
jgi:hypothetical protein